MLEMGWKPQQASEITKRRDPVYSTELNFFT